MNELFQLFQQLSDKLGYMRLEIDPDEKACVFNVAGDILVRRVGASDQPVCWSTISDGVMVLRDCLIQAEAAPEDFSWF